MSKYLLPVNDNIFVVFDLKDISSDDEKIIAYLLIIVTFALFVFIIYFFSMMIRELKKVLLKAKNEGLKRFALNEINTVFV